MLENVPAGVGKALAGLRAGFEKIVSEADFASTPETISLASPAFEDEAPIPARYTEDGEGVSPPLRWSDLPAGTEALVLIVEDPDAPTPHPLAHLLAWDLAPSPSDLAEALFASPDHVGIHEILGRNSFLKAEYLPPDPPPGHGRHRYVFQLYALDEALSFDTPPTREAIVEAMKARVLAKGLLIGTYERG